MNSCRVRNFAVGSTKQPTAGLLQVPWESQLEVTTVKRLLLVLSVLTLLSTLPLSAEAVDGYLMDTMCSVMMADKGVEGAKKHTKACGMAPDCKKSGFGVVTLDSVFLKFDTEGDKKAVELLEGTDKTDNIQVTVDGEVDGKKIAVKSLTLS